MSKLSFLEGTIEAINKTIVENSINFCEIKKCDKDFSFFTSKFLFNGESNAYKTSLNAHSHLGRGNQTIYYSSVKPAVRKPIFLTGIALECFPLLGVIGNHVAFPLAQAIIDMITEIDPTFGALITDNAGVLTVNNAALRYTCVVYDNRPLDAINVSPPGAWEMYRIKGDLNVSGLLFYIDSVPAVNVAAVGNFLVNDFDVVRDNTIGVKTEATALKEYIMGSISPLPRNIPNLSSMSDAIPLRSIVIGLDSKEPNLCMRTIFLKMLLYNHAFINTDRKSKFYAIKDSVLGQHGNQVRRSEGVFPLHESKIAHLRLYVIDDIDAMGKKWYTSHASNSCCIYLNRKFGLSKDAILFFMSLLYAYPISCVSTVANGGARTYSHISQTNAIDGFSEIILICDANDKRYFEKMLNIISSTSIAMKYDITYDLIDVLNRLDGSIVGEVVKFFDDRRMASKSEFEIARKMFGSMLMRFDFSLSNGEHIPAVANGAGHWSVENLTQTAYGRGCSRLSDVDASTVSQMGTMYGIGGKTLALMLMGMFKCDDNENLEKYFDDFNATQGDYSAFKICLAVRAKIDIYAAMMSMSMSNLWLMSKYVNSENNRSFFSGISGLLGFKVEHCSGVKTAVAFHKVGDVTEGGVARYFNWFCVPVLIVSRCLNVDYGHLLTDDYISTELETDLIKELTEDVLVCGNTAKLKKDNANIKVKTELHRCEHMLIQRDGTERLSYVRLDLAVVGQFESEISGCVNLILFGNIAARIEGNDLNPAVLANNARLVTGWFRAPINMKNSSVKLLFSDPIGKISNIDNDGKITKLVDKSILKSWFARRPLDNELYSGGAIRGISTVVPVDKSDFK